MQLDSYPCVATSFFSFMFFLPFGFVLFILTADHVSFARFLRKRISSFRGKQGALLEAICENNEPGAGKSIFCAKERDVSLLFVRSTAAIFTNNTQALLHV